MNSYVGEAHTLHELYNVCLQSFHCVLLDIDVKIKFQLGYHLLDTNDCQGGGGTQQSPNCIMFCLKQVKQDNNVCHLELYFGDKDVNSDVILPWTDHSKLLIKIHENPIRFQGMSRVPWSQRGPLCIP